MFVRSIREGVRRAQKRFRLVLLIYFINLLLAFVLALPVYHTLRRTVSTTGFSAELTKGFDFVLWADILVSASSMFANIPMQIAWAIPILFLWKVASCKPTPSSKPRSPTISARPAFSTRRRAASLTGRGR